MRRLVARAVRRVPGRAGLMAALSSWYLRWALPSSGIFDREFYEAQRGVTFRSGRAALADFLRQGRTTAYSPHPLFEPQWYAGGRTGVTVRYLRAYLMSGPGTRDCSPLFDSRAYLARVPEAARHRGGALGHFLATATADSVLPVPTDYPGTPPTWGTVRSRLIELARTQAAGADLVHGRASRTPARVLPLPSQRPARSGSGDPLVSVVLPVRNRAGLVADAVASVQAQTYDRWELLVVDDGSSDGTAEVLRDLAAQDARIRVIAGAGRGLSAARNEGLREARGELVAFLDSDYRFVGSHLSTMVASIGDEPALAAATEVQMPDAVRRLTGVPGLPALLVGADVDINAMVVRRDVLVELGGFDESLARSTHLDLVIRLSQRGTIPAVDVLGARGITVPEGVETLGDRDSDHWFWVALGRHLVRWDDVRAGLGARVDGRMSVSMPTYRDWEMTVSAVRSVLDHSDGHDVEVVVVDNGSERSVSAILTSAFLGDPRVRVVPQARNLNFALGTNVGMAVSTGSIVVCLNNDTQVLAGWLDGLAAHLDDPTCRGVQPLLLYPDGTIQSAGSLLPGGDTPPVALLAGMPPQDAHRAGTLRTRVVTAAALMVRAEEFARLEGFDPFFVNGQEDVDYCLRAVDLFGGRFDVVTGSTVIHHESKTPGRGARIQENRALLVERWRGRLVADGPDVLAPTGLRIDHWDPPASTAFPDDIRIPSPAYVRDRHLVTDGPAVGLPSLRWALKLAAHPGPRGDGWGDVHFGDSLARSLERLGQQVVIDRREAFERPTSGLDDVVLVIRGLEEVLVQPGRVNLLWVISHPDLVTDRELRTFDGIFAASESWARRMSDAGHRVLPLLQATDPARFHPGLADAGHRTSALFVGRSRNILRPIVRDAVEAGLDLAIYGDRWEQFGLDRFVRGQYLPYDEVGAAYASADVVLNDHWADMAREGFLSNRLFDAVAAGARVVTDEVEGVETLFGGAVRVYRTAEDLASLVSPEGLDRFPSAEERRTIAARVAEEHSFDRRARSLLDAAIAIRRQQGWAVPGDDTA